MNDPAEELRRLTTLKPVKTLCEDDGRVLLWWEQGRRVEVGDLDDADGHRVIYEDPPTHWSPIPKVKEPES